MARFYKTSLTPQQNYTVDPRLYRALSGAMGPKSSTKASKKELLNGHVEVIPDDIPAYSEVKKEYESEVAKLTSELRQNPEGYKSIEPRISQLQQRMAADASPGGRLYAFEERAKQYNSYLDNAKKAAGDNQDLYEFNLSNIDTGGSYIDENGRPVPVKASFTNMWDQKAEQDFLKTVKTTITPKLLKDAEVKGLEIGSKYKDAVSIMTDLGYTDEQVKDYIMGNITPDMVQSMEYTHRYAKRAGHNVPEDFEDYVVGKVNSWSTAISGIKSAQRQTVTSDTDLAIAEKRRRAAAAGDKEEFTKSWYPLVDVMTEAVKKPTPELKKAIQNKEDKFIPIQSATDAFSSMATSANFGIDNQIVAVAYNPAKGKYYYRGLYDLRDKKGTINADWVELSTATLDNLKGNAKFDNERFARRARESGILNEDNLFDFSKVTPSDEEGDIDDEFDNN